MRTTDSTCSDRTDAEKFALLARAVRRLLRRVRTLESELDETRAIATEARAEALDAAAELERLDELERRLNEPGS